MTENFEANYAHVVSFQKRLKIKENKEKNIPSHVEVTVAKIKKTCPKIWFHYK